MELIPGILIDCLYRYRTGIFIDCLYRYRPGMPRQECEDLVLQAVTQVRPLSLSCMADDGTMRAINRWNGKITFNQSLKCDVFITTEFSRDKLYAPSSKVLLFCKKWFQILVFQTKLPVLSVKIEELYNNINIFLIISILRRLGVMVPAAVVAEWRSFLRLFT